MNGCINWRAPWKAGVSTYFVAIFQFLGIRRNLACWLFLCQKMTLCFFPQETDTGGGGWGGFSCNLVYIFLPSWKKKHGHFVTQKESACQISADSKQLEKSQQNRYLRLPSEEPFNCFTIPCGQHEQQHLSIVRCIEVIDEPLPFLWWRVSIKSYMHNHMRMRILHQHMVGKYLWLTEVVLVLQPSGRFTFASWETWNVTFWQEGLNETQGGQALADGETLHKHQPSR